MLYDKGGDRHYDYISAWIKATRGSDPDASLYYLAVMLEGGEDPRFIVRRMVIFASEDVGNADPGALGVAVAAAAAVEHVGMPEAKFALAQAAIYLALAPKSNSRGTGIGRRPTARARARRGAGAGVAAAERESRDRRRTRPPVTTTHTTIPGTSPHRSSAGGRRWARVSTRPTRRRLSLHSGWIRFARRVGVEETVEAQRHRDRHRACPACSSLHLRVHLSECLSNVNC